MFFDLSGILNIFLLYKMHDLQRTHVFEPYTFKTESIDYFQFFFSSSAVE